MLSNKIKLICALAVFFAGINIASAGGFDTRCCCGHDAYTKNAYSKFNDCCVIPDYPQQRFLNPSP